MWWLLCTFIGHVLIINNEKWPDNQRGSMIMPDRPGSGFDRDKLKKLFKDLNFSAPIVEENLSSKVSYL